MKLTAQEYARILVPAKTRSAKLTASPAKRKPTPWIRSKAGTVSVNGRRAVRMTMAAGRAAAQRLGKKKGAEAP